MVVESNVLKAMAEKGIGWNWMMLDRILAIRDIPGFGNIANTVTKLVNRGLVGVVSGGDDSKPRYGVSRHGLDLVKEQQDNLF